MGTQILSLIIKEFIAILGDKRSRMVIMVPPILQVLVFGYAATYNLNNIPFAVFNEDCVHASRSLIARFDGSPSFDRIATLESTKEIDPLIDSAEALLVIHIGQEFSDDLSAGRRPVVQLNIDGRNSNTALIAANDAQSIVGSFAYELLGSVNRRGPDAVLVDRVWYNPNLLSRWLIVPGIVGLLTMVVTTMVTSLSIARERELGKAISPYIIGVAEAGFIVLVAIYWFHVPFRGNLGTLFIGIACFLLSAIGVGLAISSIARTMQQGLLGAFLFLVPSVILSGFATPIANMPHLVQQLTLINPLRYYMVVLRGVFLEGATLSSLSSQLWPMLVIGIFNLAVAQWLFRHRST